MDSDYSDYSYYFKTSFYNQTEFLIVNVARGHFVYTDIFLENILAIESHVEQIGCKSYKKATQLRKKIKVK